jgi:hypothetical protein
MKTDSLVARWQGSDLVVSRDGGELDRLPSAQVQRVVLVCRGGDTPAHLDFALIDTGDEHVLLPAATGIAAAVYFERQAWWTERACIYWLTSRHAPLPRRLYSGVWLLRSHQPGFLRLPAEQLLALVAQWPLEGPQTWEQRRGARVGASGQLEALARRPRG